MIKHLRLPLRFDADRMLHEVRSLEAKLWKDHYQVLHYEGAWRALPLRSQGGRPDDVYISPVPGAVYQDTPMLEACPYLREVLAAFRCPLQAARLMKLDAGAVIKEHRDAGLCAEEGEARFHIPVLTHPDVAFVLDGDRLPLQAGECWYLNFNLPHSVRNESQVDRIHLVIDALADDWVRGLLADEKADCRRDMEAPDPYGEKDRRAMIGELRRMGTPTASQMAEEMEKKLLSRF
ncbi:MAG TPA: aspartyl/asparaginyl beta-hydroxylase domain-containing protein [Holophagaceae bacterium]|nr:aspartyl/asparaginyl beta-hydroxylase domain-containing protein [Holophagaceae bacterium]